MFKYGELVQVANELVQDSVDRHRRFRRPVTARAVGRRVGTALAVGTGTGEPQGYITGLAGGGAGSVATGGTLITVTYENLVDCQHKIADLYRDSTAGWLANDQTYGTLSKLRSDSGGNDREYPLEPKPDNGADRWGT